MDWQGMHQGWPSGIMLSQFCTFLYMFVLVLVICINIFTFEPNLHISQMTSLASKLLDDVINMHNLQKYYANILENKFHHWGSPSCLWTQKHIIAQGWLAFWDQNFTVLHIPILSQPVYLWKRKTLPPTPTQKSEKPHFCLALLDRL